MQEDAGQEIDAALRGEIVRCRYRVANQVAKVQISVIARSEIRQNRADGWVAERFKAPVLKFD
jgi:hypothetical protein